MTIFHDVGDTPAIFVYGTLMPGERRWPLLLPYAGSWSEATAPGRLWDTGNGYPAATFDDEASEVRGVLVVLTPGVAEEAIRVLDEIEAEGTLYRRRLVITSRGSALTYEWLGPTEALALLPGAWERRPHA
ncbi:MAG: gamma-glutamylcyclotransferase [Actinomycetota bacterium]|nr:gamma-glutamylcyclotransferase [Actinomycetota bacterium]